MPQKKRSHEKRSHKAGSRKAKSVRPDPLPKIIAEINAFNPAAPNAQSVFFEQIRAFFSNYLNLNKELTYEEIGFALEKKRLARDLRAKAVAFLNKLPSLEYSGATMPQEHMTHLHNEFRGIILSLAVLPEQRAAEKKLLWYHEAGYGLYYLLTSFGHAALVIHKALILFWLRLFSLLGIRIKRRELTRELKKVASIDAMLRARSRMADIRNLHDAERYFAVRKKYLELFRLYNDLPLAAKQQLYPELRSLRNQISAGPPADDELLGHIRNITNAIEKREHHHVRKHYHALLSWYSLLGKEKQKQLYPHVRRMHVKVRRHFASSAAPAPGVSAGRVSGSLLDKIRELEREFEESPPADAAAAKQKYLALHKAYAKLSRDEQKRVYRQLAELRIRLLQ